MGIPKSNSDPAISFVNAEKSLVARGKSYFGLPKSYTNTGNSFANAGKSLDEPAKSVSAAANSFGTLGNSYSRAPKSYGQTVNSFASGQKLFIGNELPDHRAPCGQRAFDSSWSPFQNGDSGRAALPEELDKRGGTDAELAPWPTGCNNQRETMLPIKTNPDCYKYSGLTRMALS